MAIGLPWADPVVGLLITVAILFVLRDAARQIYRRLMDAIDPALLDAVEAAALSTPGVHDLGAVRVRWIGHTLRAEIEITVDNKLTLIEAHDVAHETEHDLLHNVPRLTSVLVHANPGPSRDYHHITAHHSQS